MALGSWILCSGLFTIGANDKIEKNAQYTVSSRMKIIKWLAYVAELLNMLLNLYPIHHGQYLTQEKMNQI